MLFLWVWLASLWRGRQAAAPAFGGLFPPSAAPAAPAAAAPAGSGLAHGLFCACPHAPPWRLMRPAMPRLG
ncbi:hypothetical protein ADJ79_00700 [Ottowia sp. oral taxon 894]|uniref:hypothetical protein n=1 Tax=Ottowia sp. oral taxon 894 TaxID=1658672 RepID=UPI00067FE32D|nr:hypothetical protein [Ottowia sp. oral taxon 894]AKU66129.1 hypothetical protein ADJ79_00700 [Ottowia sp. oral taxon 894]